MTRGFGRMAVAALAALAATSHAGLIAPPWRGEAMTTYADWQFPAETPNPSIANPYTNPWGVPTALITLDAEMASGWYSTYPEIYGAATGFWDIARGGTNGGAITLNVPHPTGAPANTLTVVVQVVYWDDISDAPTVLVPGGTMTGSPSNSLIAVGPVGGGWYAERTQWTVAPGWGATGLVKVDGDAIWGSVIDRIMLDTRYEVPEPSAAVMLAAAGGLLGLLARRRRAK